MSGGSAPVALKFDNVVFHHVPNHQAPGLLAAMLVYAFCLGAILMELLTNVVYDWRLIKRQGWCEPIKAVNRLAYFICRYGSFVFLLITIIYMNLPGSNCPAYARAINVMWLLPLIFVDLIFVQRTLAVYGWNLAVSTALGALYFAYVGLCMYSVIEFGYGYRIPTTEFCAYQVNSTKVQPHASVFIAYVILTIFLDSLILLLTTHRLVEGGLGNVPNLLITKSAELSKAKAARKAAGHEVGEVSLSGLLLRQGVGYFLVLEGSRLAFLIVYYVLSSETSYQVLVSGILCTIGPIMAGFLFRQTSEAVKRTAYGSSRGGQGGGGVLSQGRSYRSSTGGGLASGRFSPTTPLTPNITGHLVNAPMTGSTAIATPHMKNEGDGSDVDDDVSAGYPFYVARSSSSGGAAAVGGNDSNKRGLRIFVDEKTNVEMSPIKSQPSRFVRQQQQQQLSSATPFQDDEVPIDHRFMRQAPASPLSAMSHGGTMYEGETAFTPVSSSARPDSGYVFNATAR